METTIEVGQAVRDVCYKEGCTPQDAAAKVLKRGRANGGFGDTFMLSAILNAERSIVTRRKAYSEPVPYTKPTRRDDSGECGPSSNGAAIPIIKLTEDDWTPQDIEIPLPNSCDRHRKRLGDLTREDLNALQRQYGRHADTYRKSSRAWGEVAKCVPPGETVGENWEQIPPRFKKQITGKK